MAAPQLRLETVVPAITPRGAWYATPVPRLVLLAIGRVALRVTHSARERGCEHHLPLAWSLAEGLGLTHNAGGAGGSFARRGHDQTGHRA
jgi:hypothetical protein